RDILFRAADRARVTVTLVANRPVRVPRSTYIRTLQVMPGFDVADNEIVRRAETGDIVITADIPLAAEVMDKGAHALNPRGELYSRDTIRQRLAMRDFMDTLRASGIQSGGPSAMGQAERKAFANHLDALLAKRKNVDQGES